MNNTQTNILTCAIIVGVGYLLAGKFGSAITFGCYLICGSLWAIQDYLKIISTQLDDLKDDIKNDAQRSKFEKNYLTK